MQLIKDGKSLAGRWPALLLLAVMCITPALAVETVRVNPSDTLWMLADKMRPAKSISVQQVMLALLRANPQAFSRNNINGLKANVDLAVPSADEMRLLSRAEAAAEARTQYQEWKAGASSPNRFTERPVVTRAAAKPEVKVKPAVRKPAAAPALSRPAAPKAKPPASERMQKSLASQRRLEPLAARVAQASPAAANGAARVHLSTGRVMAATPDGDIRELKKDGEVYNRDTISTGPNSYVRMKFSDDGYVMLRPNSRFQIKDYQYTGSKEKDKNYFSLIKGGFRAVTGLVGQANKSSYRMDTPVATIGIRGTDHEGRFCQGDCLDIDPPPPDGMYVKVHDGAVYFQTDGGTVTVTTGGIAYTPDARTPPTSINEADPNPLGMPPADPAGCPVQ